MAVNTKGSKTSDVFDMSVKANEINRGFSKSIAILGKEYSLRTISTHIAVRITNLSYDALYLERQAKKEGVSLADAKRINTKIRQIPAKIAAYYNLGRWAYIPFVHAIWWRILFNRSEEVSARINAEATLRDEGNFFLANSEVIKRLLVLSMIPVGESVKQMLERKESAESMLDEDASPKKEEDNKSQAPSRAARTTKR